MTTAPALSPATRALLRCPACRGELGCEVDSEPLRFRCRACARAYPVLRGVPVLIDEDESLFTLASYSESSGERLLARESTAGTHPLAGFKRGMDRSLPGLERNLSARRNFARFGRLLRKSADGLAASPRLRVLVVGGREEGRGMRELLGSDAIELVETDIDFGPRTSIVADGHQLPFADGSFHGVIAQAVLEHVADPYRCVAEIHRVLLTGGLVYAETPFLQHRHGGRFDFTRFTYLGHRRLFRHFDKIDAGAAVGPGSALAWQWRGWLLSFSDRRSVRAFLRWAAHLTAFWLPFPDRFLARHEAAIDSASGFYFLGRRSENVLPDRELLREFRGIE